MTHLPTLKKGAVTIRLLVLLLSYFDLSPSQRE